jgi:hypothetical protein
MAFRLAGREFLATQREGGGELVPPLANVTLWLVQGDSTGMDQPPQSSLSGQPPSPFGVQGKESVPSTLTTWKV